MYRNRADLSYPPATLSAVVYNYNNNINIIVISINTFKVRDGRIRVYKKYVYKCVPLQNRSSSNARAIIASLFLSRSLASHQLPSLSFSRTRGRSCLSKLSFPSRPHLVLIPSNFRAKQKSTHVGRETMGFLAQGAPPPPSIQYFPLCYYSFSIRLLRNCIENNRNRNQYTRYIAIIRAIVMTVFYT